MAKMIFGETSHTKCINMTDRSIGQVSIVSLDTFGNPTPFLDNSVVQCSINQNKPGSDKLRVSDSISSSTFPFLIGSFRDNNTVIFDNIQLENWNIPELHGKFELVICLTTKRYTANRQLTYENCDTITRLSIPFNILPMNESKDKARELLLHNDISDIDIEIQNKLIAFENLNLTLSQNLHNEMFVDNIEQILLEQYHNILSKYNMHQQVKKIECNLHELPKELFALDGHNIVQLVDCAYVHDKTTCEVLSWAAQKYMGALVVRSYCPEMEFYIQQSENIKVISLDMATKR
jgi:hypothetical protein